MKRILEREPKSECFIVPEEMARIYRRGTIKEEKEKGPAPLQALSRAVYTASPCLKYTANGPKSQEKEDKQGRFNTCYTH